MSADIICFGSNICGQLSNNKFTSLHKCLSLSKHVTIKNVTFSWSKCYVLLDNNTLITRGLVDGKICNTHTENLPFDHKVTKISDCGNYKLCLTEDGVCWKYSATRCCENISKLLNLSNNDASNEIKITDICCSDTLRVALSDEGIVYNIPVPMDIPFAKKVTKISCGMEHCLCLTESGSVYVWGSGSRGQLGNGSLNLVENPELLVCLDGITVVDIAAGGWHSAAVTRCGDLYTWGWNNFGQLAFPANRDLLKNKSDAFTVLAESKCVEYLEGDDKQSEMPHVKKVSCGTQHTLIILENGMVYGCGWNKYGQVDPLRSAEYFDRLVLVSIPNVNNVYDISCQAWNSSIYATVQI